MRVTSPYAAACRIPPTKTTVTVEVPFPDELQIATVEVEKPKSLAAKFWRSGAYLMAFIPGAMAADYAARALANSQTTVVVTTAPTTTNPTEPSKTAPAQKQPSPGSPITVLRLLILPVAGTLAMEAFKELFKEAGKDLWEAIKKKLKKESPSAKVEGLPSGSLKMSVHLEQTEESDSLDGPADEKSVVEFAKNTLGELYERAQARRDIYTEHPSETTRATRHIQVTATYTPRSGGPYVMVSTELN